MPTESPPQSPLQQVLTTLKDPSVRALAWSVLSKPLIESTTGTTHLHSLLPTLELGSIDDIIRFLTAEEQDPYRLHQHLQNRSSHFLGPYFESLWAYFFKHTGRYETIAQNLQIHHRGKTLGEFDFILWDSTTNKHIHVELAAKFYLQVQHHQFSSKYFPHSSTSWVGPNQIDRLDLKISALLDKQLHMAEHPVAQEHLNKLHISNLTTRTLLKGNLFAEITSHDNFLTHCLNPRHQDHCGWLRLSHFYNWINDSKRILSGIWAAPEKLAWLAPACHNLSDRSKIPTTFYPVGVKQLLTSIEQEKRPKMLTYIDVERQRDTNSKGELKQESFRIFVTPNDWPSSLSMPTTPLQATSMQYQ